MEGSAGLLASLAIFFSVCGVCTGSSPTGLLCEHRRSPALGIEARRPRFNWVLSHHPACRSPDTVQHSYQLQLAREPTLSALVFDSGQVISSATAHSISKDAAHLSAAEPYYWRVKTWLRTASSICEGNWSSSAKFTTALWDGIANETKAIWTAQTGSRYALFRKDFVLPKPIASAIVHVTAAQSGNKEKLLGAYRLYVNGVTLGIGPGRGEVYVKEVAHTLYDSIDVTAFLSSTVQKSTIRLALQCFHASGNEDAKVSLEMRVSYSDGTKAVISTDETWLALNANDLFNPSSHSTGGAYMAPQENINGSAFPGQLGWTTDPAIKAEGAWQPPAVRAPFVALKPKATLPIDFAEGLRPTLLEKLAVGHYFFDFGEEMMGGIRIELPNPMPSGLYMELTLSEEVVGTGVKQVLYPMRTGNHYRSVWSTGVGSVKDTMVLEHHEYMVFRFGELKVSASPSSFNQTVDLSSFNLTAWRVHYPWFENDSHFESSDPMLNRVWKLCRDTLRLTSLDTTTDSNTRERLPYEADGAITGSSRYVFQREFMWQRHSAAHNFLNPTWPTEWRQFMPLTAFADYMSTGDTSLFEDFYPLLFNSTQANCINKKNHNLIDFSEANGNCNRSCEDGKSSCRDIIDWPPDTRDGYVLNDVSTVINAFAVGGLRALATMSNVTGKREQAERLAAEAEAVAGGMDEALWDESTGLYVDGVGSTQAKEHSAWHAQTNPLWVDSIVEQSKQPKILQFLQKKRMAGSVYGAYAFLLGLYNMDFDHGKFALEMMTNCDESSWCHMLKVGATATMEAWSRRQKPNLSWSHPWATAAATAIAQGFMGLKALEPKFRRFLFKPQPGNATSASIVLPTFSGQISASFVVVPGVSFTARLQPPPNTFATVCLPKGNNEGAQLTSLSVDGHAVAGYLKGDYVCVDGIGSAASPSEARVIERHWSSVELVV